METPGASWRIAAGDRQGTLVSESGETWLSGPGAVRSGRYSPAKPVASRHEWTSAAVERRRQPKAWRLCDHRGAVVECVKKGLPALRVN